MSQAIDALMEEHRVIERVLDALEEDIARAESGGAVERARVAEFAEFLRGFADWCHHGKEEDILFKRLVELGFPRDHGPIGMMLVEHTHGREHVAALVEIGAGSGPATEEERQALVRHASQYISLLRQHILKEDRVLYPMAIERMSAGDLDRMQAEFEKFEREVVGEGRHRALDELAQRLTAPAGHTPPASHQP